MFNPYGVGGLSIAMLVLEAFDPYGVDAARSDSRVFECDRRLMFNPYGVVGSDWPYLL